MSLVDVASEACFPKLRLLKDKSIHSLVDWSRCADEKQLPDQAKMYAVADAVLTHLFGLEKCGFSSLCREMKRKVF